MASEAAPAAETAPETAPAAAQTPAAGISTPEAAVVEIPPGSEFNRPKPETEPVAPAPEPEPATAPLPQVATPTVEAAPAMSDETPVGLPETSPAPAAPEAPEPGAPAAIAAAPAAEAAIPVPPPGAAAAPPLAAEATPEVPMPPATPGSAPLPGAAAGPAALPETAPAAAPEAAPAPEPEPEPETEPAEVAEPAAPPSDLPAPADDAPAPPEELEEDAPAADGGPVIIGSAPDAPKTGFGQTVQPGFGGTIRPGFGQSVPGVTINRLPRIEGGAPEAGAEAGGEPALEPGAEAADAMPAPAPAPEPEFIPAPGRVPVAEPMPAEPAPGGSAATDGAPDTALRRYAAAFDNPDQKPLVAVVLVDIGEAKGGVAPDAIAALGRPVTVAIDPASGDAAARATVYRLGGDEIAILAPDLPDAATPSDLEVSYQGMAGALPEAVAVVGKPGSLFQTDRRVAQHLVSLLATEGRGLVTFTGGLNPAGQAAEGEGLPHAAVFRDLDAEGETPATIIRSLDRAAFEAARSGAVVVLGTTAPETVAALQEWIAGGAKGAVVGPVSAVMLEQ
ncbi:divergent polysaccharide deacetylase family protein [Albidovulum sp.]|uniref:divergent polysaccharide deacetylase family protein n=2 Tax=Albidovulum sp. TaxID=1872424 RepID=UPI0030544325